MSINLAFYGSLVMRRNMIKKMTNLTRSSWLKFFPRLKEEIPKAKIR